MKDWIVQNSSPNFCVVLHKDATITTSHFRNLMLISSPLDTPQLGVSGTKFKCHEGKDNVMLQSEITSA